MLLNFLGGEKSAPRPLRLHLESFPKGCAFSTKIFSKRLALIEEGVPKAWCYKDGFQTILLNQCPRMWGWGRSGDWLGKGVYEVKWTKIFLAVFGSPFPHRALANKSPSKIDGATAHANKNQSQIDGIIVFATKSNTKCMDPHCLKSKDPSQTDEATALANKSPSQINGSISLANKSQSRAAPVL